MIFVYFLIFLQYPQKVVFGSVYTFEMHFGLSDHIVHLTILNSGFKQGLSLWDHFVVQKDMSLEGLDLAQQCRG